MDRHRLAFVSLLAALLAGCALGPAGEPTQTPVMRVENLALGGPSLPPSWTPGPEHTALPRRTPTSRATLTPSLTVTFFPSPTMAPGWTEYVVPLDNYALRLPPTWLTLPPGDQDPQAVVAQVGQSDPVLAASLTHGLPPDMLARLSFMAFDSVAVLGGATFVSNLRAGLAPSGDYDDEANLRRQTLESDPQFRLESDLPLSVGFEARRGRVLRYTSVFPPDAPVVTTHHTQVFVENGRGQVVVFTFSTEGALREGYERLFELVLEGTHFTLQASP